MATRFFQKMRENNPDLLSKIGTRWSNEEEANMLQLLADGNPRNEIGKILERTEGGIRERIKLIACKMFDNSTPEDDILRITRMTKDEFDETIKKHMSSKVGKAKDVEHKILKKEPVQAKLITIPQSDIMEMKLVMFEIRDLLRKLNERM